MFRLLIFAIVLLAAISFANDGMNSKFLAPSLIVLLAVALLYLYAKQRTQKHGIKAATKHANTDHDDGYTKNDKADDAFEGWFLEAEHPKRITANLLIKYVDGEGQKTNRKVTVEAFDTDLLGGIMMGHCHLRDATRTFRFDRIKSATDIDTGEVIKDVRGYLSEKYNATPIGTLDVAICSRPDVFDLFYYLMRTDGRAMPKEKEVVAEFYRRATGNNDISKGDVTEISKTQPDVTPSQFKSIVGRLKNDADYSSILETSKAIVAASKDDPIQNASIEIMS